MKEKDKVKEKEKTIAVSVPVNIVPDVPDVTDDTGEFWQWFNSQPEEVTRDESLMFYGLMTSPHEQIYKRLVDIIRKRTIHPYTLARKGDTVTIDTVENGKNVPFTASSANLRPSLIKAVNALFFDICTGKLREGWKFARVVLRLVQLFGADKFRATFILVRDNGLTEMVDSNGINLNAEIVNLYAGINDYPQPFEWWSGKYKQHGKQIKSAIDLQVRGGRKDLQTLMEVKK